MSRFDDFFEDAPAAQRKLTPDSALSIFDDAPSKEEAAQQRLASVPPGSPMSRPAEPPGFMDQLGSAFSTLIGSEDNRPLVARASSAIDQLGSAIVPDSAERGLNRFKQGAAYSLIDDPNQAGVHLADLNRKIEARSASDEVEAAKRAITGVGSFGELGDVLLNDPLGSAEATMDVTLESMGLMAPMMASSVVGGALGGPVGAGVAGGAASLSTEYTQTILQKIAERGGDPSDPLIWSKALSDPQFMAEAKESGLKRGIPIAIFDGLSAGLAGRFLKLADGPLETGIAAVKEAAQQAFFGGSGEASAGLVDEGEINPGDVFFEMFAELPTSVPEIATNVASARSQERANAARLSAIAQDRAIRALNPNVSAGMGAVEPSAPAAPAPFVAASAEVDEPDIQVASNVAPNVAPESAMQQGVDAQAAAENVALDQQLGEALGNLMPPEVAGALAQALDLPLGADPDSDAAFLSEVLGQAKRAGVEQTPPAPVAAPLPQTQTAGAGATIGDANGRQDVVAEPAPDALGGIGPVREGMAQADVAESPLGGSAAPVAPRVQEEVAPQQSAPPAAIDYAGTNPQQGNADVESTSDSQNLSGRINKWLKSEGKPGGFKARARTKASLPDSLRSALGALERATGTRVVVFRNLTPEVESFNGVNIGDGVLYVDEKADRPAVLVAAHEWLHQVRRDDPASYERLKQALVDAGGDFAGYADKLKREKNSRNPDKDGEEFVGDALADAMTDPTFLRRLADRSPGAFREVARAFLDFLNTMLGRIRDRGTNEYIRDVEVFRAELESMLADYGADASGNKAASDTESDPAFQRNPSKQQAPTFYSAMLESVTQAKGAPKKGSPSVWKQWLDGAQRRGEFKQSERDWLGVDAWLDAQDQPVTREMLADFVRANEVQVRDVVLGDVDVEQTPSAEELFDKWWEGEGGDNYLYDEAKREVDNAWDDPSHPIWEALDHDREWFESTYDEDEAQSEFEELATKAASENPANAFTEEQLDEYREQAFRDYKDSFENEAEDLLRKAKEEASQELEMRGESKSPTKFEGYRTPGGENYRELLLTLPENADGARMSEYRERLDEINRLANYGGQISATEASRRRAALRDEYGVDAIGNSTRQYRSSHWDQPNVLAHVRFDERTDAEGKRVLFVQEIQSDWHQEGRKKGYKGEFKSPPDGYTVRRLPWINGATSWGFEFIDPVWNELSDRSGYESEQDAIEGAWSHATNDLKNPVPNAPLKQTDEWAMLAFKRMARWAVDNGFDRIAWATGEQNADVFNLSNQVEFVYYSPYGDGTYEMSAEAKGSRREIDGASGRMDLKKISEVFGKDIADRIEAGVYDAEQDGVFALSGDNLKLGGEGMRGFYDKILPTAVGKWAKKFGARVGQVTLPAESQFDKFDGLQNDSVVWTFDSRYAAQQWSRAEPGRSFRPASTEGTSVHAVDITPQMREAVEGGQPMFQRKSDQTQTKAFRDWFGDSKVVDENGEPLVVYHGTAAKDGKLFSSFDPSLLGSSTGANSAKRAFFFSASPSNAAEFANKASSGNGGDTLIPAYLALENPLIVDADPRSLYDSYADIIKRAKDGGHDGVIFENAVDTTRQKALTVGGVPEHDVDSRGEFLGSSLPAYIEAGRPQSMVEELQEELDDAAEWYQDEYESAASDGSVDEEYKQQLKHEAGVWDRIAKAFRADPASLDIDYGTPATVYAVFDPTNIKSAIGNRGTFDPKNPDIRFSRRTKAEAPAGDGSSPGAAAVDFDFPVDPLVGKPTAKSIMEAGRILSLIDAAKSKGVSIDSLRSAYAAKDAGGVVEAINKILSELLGNSEPRVTGVKNAVTDEERREAGKDPILRDAVRGNEETVVEAIRTLKDNPMAGREAVSRLSRAGVDGITLADEALILVYKTKLLNERNAAEKRLSDETLSDEEKEVARQVWDESEAKITEVDIAAVNSGREWGRFGQFRQRMMREDFTLAGLERKERVRLGRPLNAQESAKVKEMAEKIAAAQKKIDELSEKLTNTESLVAYDSMVKNIEAVRKDRPRLDALRDAAEAARARIAAAKSVKSAMKQSGAIINPAIFYDYAVIGAYHIANGASKFSDWVDAMRADIGEALEEIREHLPAIFRASEKELLKASKTEDGDAVSIAAAKIDVENVSNRDVYRLAEAHVKAGLRGEAKVMAATHKTLQELGVDVSERDVRRMFSDYGNAKFPSQDAAKVELRQLRALVQMQESIDRLEEGSPALKSGPQRDKDTQEIREKRARLNELLKNLSAGAKTPEQLASYNDARIRNLNNQIEDLQKQIDTGTRPQPKAKAEQSEQVAKLIERRDALRRERDSIDAGARKNEAEKQSLRKKIAEFEARINGKVKPKPEKESRVDDEEMTGLRDQLAALRAKRAALSAESAARKSIEAQISNLLQRLAGKEKPAPKPQKVDSAEIANLKRIRDELSADLRELERPPVDEEARYQQTRGKAIAKRIEELRRRINEGDFEVRKRVPRALNEANQNAQFELEKAKREFLKYQFEDQLNRRTKLQKIFGTVPAAFNLARAVITSFDYSAIGRQGGFISFGHPIRAARSIVPSLRAFMSEKAEFAVRSEIESRENAKLYAKYGLQLTGIGSGPLTQIEEAYASRWLEKVPAFLGGGLVRGSGRAYTSFLNKLRADSFDAMAATLGRSSELTDAEGKAIANYINVATGRGKIGVKETPSQILNTVFFAPRLVASRFQLLAGQPLYGGSAKTRKMIVQEYARFLIGVGVVYALAAFAMGGDDDEDKPLIGLDPRSADFGRIRFGNSYIDPLAGLAQVSTFVGRMASGETVSGDGKVKPLRPGYTLTDLRRLFGSDVPAHELGKDGELGFGKVSAAGVLGNFVRSKLAPVPGGIINALSGSNMIGDPVTPSQAMIDMVKPMTFGDIADVMEEHGVARGTALGLLVVLGVGVQVRDEKNHLVATDNARADIRDRLSKLPSDQWKSAMEDMRDEYGPILDGVELAIYKADGKYGKAGDPRMNADGLPVLKTNRLSDQDRMRSSYRQQLASQGLSDAQIDAKMDANSIHHIIPDNVTRQHPLMIVARKNGYDLDNPDNLVGMTKTKKDGEIGHWTSHPRYDSEVVKELDSALKALRREHGSLEDAPIPEVLKAVRRIEKAMRARIDSGDVPTKAGRLAFVESDSLRTTG